MSIGPDIRTRLSTGARGSVIATVSAMAASFVSQVWLARRFGPEGLGEYNATSLFVTVLTTLLLLGVPVALAERVASLHETGDRREQEAVRGALTVTLVLGIGGVVLTAAAWPVFTGIARLADPAPLALLLAATMGAVLQSFLVTVLLARLRMGLATAVVLVQPLSVAGGLIASYGAAAMNGSILGALGFVSGGLGSTFVLVKEGIGPGRPQQETRRIGGATLAGTAVLYLTVLSTWLDRLVVVVIAGPAALGAFAVASFLGEAILRVPRNAGSFGTTAYARLAQDPIGVRRVLDSQVRIMSAFFIMAAAFLVSAGNGLLAVIFGEGFEIATTTLRLLAIALVPTGVALALAASAVGTRRHGRLAAALVVLVPLQVLLASVGARLFGIAGVALAGLVVWSFAVVILASGPAGRVARPGDGTLLRVVGVAAPTIVSALVIGSVLQAHWIVRGSLSTAIALAAVITFMLGEPERRILRRLGGQWGEATA